MSNVAVVTDSVAAIPATILQKLNIHWIPYYIHRGGEVLRDLVTIHPGEFYRWLATARELPTTAAPGPGDYLEMYRRLALDQGIQEIISIHMTSLGSGAYQAAMAAKSMLAERLPDVQVEVVDTLNVSMCHGWMVIEAARSALEGASLGRILAQVKGMIPITRMIQTADTLKYLYLGGRIGKASHLVGSLLNIKPLISMEEGVIVSVGQARSRLKAYQKMVALVESAVGSMGQIKIAYVHAAALEQVEKIRLLIEARLSPVESLIVELPPALGVHTGPGTAGLCYFPVKSDC